MHEERTCSFSLVEFTNGTAYRDSEVNAPVFSARSTVGLDMQRRPDGSNFGGGTMGWEEPCFTCIVLHHEST